MLKKSHNQLFYDRNIITDRTVRNKSLDTTTNKSYFIDVPFLTVATSTAPSPRSFRNIKTQIRADNFIENKRGVFNTISIICKGFIANSAGKLSLT